MLRSDFEVTMIARLGRIMDLIGMNVTSVGTNPDLSDPWDWANRNADGSIDCIQDLGELRLVISMIGNCCLVDTKSGPISEALGQIGKALEAKKANLESYIKATYGIGLATITTGVINLDFQTHGGD